MTNAGGALNQASPLVVGDKPRTANRLTAVTEAKFQYSLLHALGGLPPLGQPVQPPEFVVLYTCEPDLERPVFSGRRTLCSHALSIGACPGPPEPAGRRICLSRVYPGDSREADFSIPQPCPLATLIGREAELGDVD